MICVQKYFLYLFEYCSIIFLHIKSNHNLNSSTQRCPQTWIAHFCHQMRALKKSNLCQCINLLIWLIKSYHVWPPFHAAYVNEWDTQWGKIHDLRSEKNFFSLPGFTFSFFLPCNLSDLMVAIHCFRFISTSNVFLSFILFLWFSSFSLFIYLHDL